MPYVSAGRSRLYYEVHGEGPPVILAHGVGGNHASWFNQVPTLAQRYQTIVIDHRGFGNSDDVEELGRSAYVDDLALLLDELQLPPVFLVGQSMGGGSCAAFACRWPERVRALLHADSLAGVVLPPPHDNALAKLNAATWGLSQVERVLGPDIRARSPEQTFLYLQIASFNSVSLKTVKGEMPKWSPAELAASGVPTLFVVGEKDIICPPALVRVLHEAVPGSRFKMIPVAGHSAYFEAHEAFNAVLLDFLDSFAPVEA
ncbi:MAG TPA: alpha/beta hydrolase [Caulobacteraceae bacterium]|jgi:pimeloyl-ACP methyl ester carboxylesterase|nr:alpha/beta hydrolase [Caulobacteraceae bacterium]